jgi:hypothetical protein
MRTSLLSVALLVPLLPVPKPLIAQVMEREDNIDGWHDHEPTKVRARQNEDATGVAPSHSQAKPDAATNATRPWTGRRANPRECQTSRRPQRHLPHRALVAAAIALLCAVLLPAGVALAQEASASKEVPARIGNIWGGFNHQPTESQVQSAERVRGIASSAQQQTLEAQIVQQLYQQVLKSAGASRTSAAAG